MALKFETKIQNLVRKSFEDKGLELITFSANLDFSDKVKAKIDSRNEVNTNVSVIDQQIIEQRKRNELAALRAEENVIPFKLKDSEDVYVLSERITYYNSSSFSSKYCISPVAIIFAR